MLTEKQFNALVYIMEMEKVISQREIAKRIGCSLGSTNKVMGELSDLHYIVNGRLTEDGIGELENYRVKRAVFMAAGFGSRLVPITLNTPKPLVRIKGKRIIDTLIDAVYSAGIEEIYIVRGYLGEQFDQLLYQYPGIRFIENPTYNESNNIASALYACDHLNRAYILDADLYLKNPSLITKYQYTSNYLGVPVDVTDDWCLKTKNGIIDSIALGGEDCYCWIGISYWTEADGKRLAKDIKRVYQMPGGKERYWDQVPLECCRGDYRVSVRECTFDDVIEIDTFRELKQIDKSYDV